MTASTVPRPSRLRLNAFQKEALSGFLFISPWLLGFLIFVLGPMVALIYLSFTRWDLVGSPRWVGVRNYVRLFEDPLFRQSLKVTIGYGLGRVPLGIIVALSVALLLNQKVKFVGFWRVIYYMPVVLPSVAVALVWMWIYNPRYGVLNGFIRQLLGVEGPRWLDDPLLVLPSLMVMAVWVSAGRNMIIYLSGLQGISQELYDASAIDGANSWHRFWKITLPLLTPIIFFNLVTGMIDTFKLFTQAYVMTEGGPRNASLFFTYYLYQNAFQRFRMGYASAMALVVFVIIMLLTLLIFRSSRAWVYYESEIAGGGN
ncbi:MAG: sugar ABC transporter permease [Caldilineae bacterium]|nr:MAG: sugar ABC transporter permease [Caldilineae bacterium]